MNLKKRLKTMKIKQIRINASRTINLGNYESLKIEGECTVEIDETDYLLGEDDFLPAARQKALDEVAVQLNNAYDKFKPKTKG